MKLRNVILFLLLASVLCTGVFATEDRILVFDGADVLTDSEEAAVNEVLNRASINTDMDILVVTRDNAYADETSARNLFLQKTEKDDGVILLITFSGSSRYYYLYANGLASDILDGRAFDKIEKATLSYLRESQYEEAFIAYGEACEEGITSHEKLPVFGIILCILIGAGLSFLLPMNMLKGQLKTVRSQPAAASYIQKESLNVTVSRDTFLYRNVTRVPKPQNNSPGGGSRGGGRGGSF